MAELDRRKFLIAAGATAGTAAIPLVSEAAPRPAPSHFDNATAMLYDATRCIGCRACQRACRKKNDLAKTPMKQYGQEFDAPRGLGPDTWMQIRVVEAKPGAGPAGKWTFTRDQCMHCNVPGCATACPVAALKKQPDGGVTYEADRCIGCRYCQLACPYGVPRYEWVDRSPRVRKCVFALACADACPTGALVTGGRREMIKLAHKRIADDPDSYFDHVYGEHEAGGSSYLLLSSLSPTQLDLPNLDAEVRSTHSDAVIKGLPGWIVGMGLLLGGLHQMEKRSRREDDKPGEEEP